MTGGLGSVGPSLENLAGGGGGGGGGGRGGGGGGGIGMGSGMGGGGGMDMGGNFGGKNTIVFCLVLKRFHEFSIKFCSAFFVISEVASLIFEGLFEWYKLGMSGF